MNGVIVVSIVLLFFLLMGAIFVVTLAAMWKIFEKAGRQGWEGIVPIYNSMVLSEIVGRPNWWGLLVLIPYAGPIFGIILMLDLGKAFGKDLTFTILGLVLFTPIGYLILGFGSDTYQWPGHNSGGNSGLSNPPIPGQPIQN